MTLDQTILDAHRQLFDYSCIPMAVELVLKLNGHWPPARFDLQNAWGNAIGSFGDFHGREIDGLRFSQGFTQPRDPQFKQWPFDIFYQTIERELSEDRYVIVSLESLGGWHMWVIHAQAPGNEFLAVSKEGPPSRATIHIDDVMRQTLGMGGTDILTYN